MKRMEFGFITFLILFSIMFFTGCGQVVEQNQLALVLKTLGDRDAKAINQKDVKSDKKSKEVADNFSATLITATRAPMERPGTKVLIFPLGLQAYKFSAKPSIESPENEGITVDPIGGTVTLDIVVHLYIDRNDSQIKEKLIKLMKAYQLRQYSGSGDVLAKLVAGRFSKILRQPFIEFAANRSAITLMRNKKKLNQFALNKLNERFNPLGLKFTMVAVSSSMTVPKAQQAKMNDIMLQDVKMQILDIENKEIAPLELQIEGLQQEGKTTYQKILNEARATKINKITEAKKKRQDMFIKLVDKENYINLESMLNTVKNLKGAKTKIRIIPEKSWITPSSDKPAATVNK